MSFPRYPKYKDSGVEWLGEVPEHWEVDRLKWSVASCRNGIWGDEPQNNEDDVPCVRVADFDRQRMRAVLAEPTIRNVTAKERLGRVLERGDLLLEKSGGGEAQPVGFVVLYDDSSPAICSNFVARVRLAAGMAPSFWRYLHAASYTVRLNTRSIKQTSGIQNLDQQQYFDERCVFPPSAEQTAIGTFLDRETAKIDALIAQQQRLIELLQEKRQAVISRAVTKGLNPDAPMKDSGIAWLGEVPEHWTILPSRRLFGQRNESAKATDKQVTASQKYGIVFQADFVEMEGRRVVETITGTHTLRRVHPNDFVISLRSFQGGIEWCRIQGSITFHYVVLTPLKCVCEPFFAHLFKSDAYIQALRSTTNLIRDGQDLRYSHFVQVPLPVVPLEEQREIAAYLDTSVAQFDVLASEASNFIALLQERRSALISAAVTGQIDVRGLTGSEAA